MSLGLSGASADSQNEFAALTLNGKVLASDACVIDGAVYLPVRAVSEALGYTIWWSDLGGVQSVTLNGSGSKITLDLTNQRINDNGHNYYVQGSYQGNGLTIIDEKTYLEARYMKPLLSLSSASIGNTITLTAAVQKSADVKNVKSETNDGELKVTIQYPQIEGLENRGIQSSINNVFIKAADDAKAEGVKNAKELADSEYSGPNGCETYFNYIVEYNANGILSVVLLDYQYAAGAHGGTFESSHTFDLKTGKELKLSDLFSGDYTSYINTSIRKNIDDKVSKGLLYELAQFKTIGDNPNFYLSDNSVVLYFQEYEYFPYAAGIQEFPIVLKDLTVNSTYSFLSPKTVTLSSDKNNILSVGDIGRIDLKGNPTTGYQWFCTMGDSSVLGNVASGYIQDSSGDKSLAGAGGTYTWEFKALTAGTTILTFKYYRSWEGESSAAKTLTYTVTVK